MADPFTLGILLVTFAKSFADQAGSRTADLVFDAVTRPRAQELPTDLLGQEAARRIQGDHGFAAQAAVAINADIVSFPQTAQEIVERTPGLLQQMLGVSSAQARSQNGKCPVGNHWMITPTYLLPDGSSVSSATTFSAMRKRSPLMRARCRKGHVWPVFPVLP